MKCLLEQFKSHPPEVEWQCSSPGCNAPLLLSSAELKSFGESEEFSRIHKLTETALRKIKAKNFDIKFINYLISYQLIKYN